MLEEEARSSRMVVADGFWDCYCEQACLLMSLTESLCFDEKV